jgi:hypothetical protein
MLKSERVLNTCVGGWSVALEEEGRCPVSAVEPCILVVCKGHSKHLAMHLCTAL